VVVRLDDVGRFGPLQRGVIPMTYDQSRGHIAVLCYDEAVKLAAVVGWWWLAASGIAHAAPPAIAWSADGARVVIGEFWCFDPASSTFYEPDGHPLSSGKVSVKGKPPTSALANPSGTFSAWASETQLCFSDAREPDRVWCVRVPEDPRPRRAARTAQLRRWFGEPRELYWIDPGLRCQRWSLRLVDGTLSVQSRRGDTTVEYTLDLGADRLSLRGPIESNHGETRALGCVKDYEIGELHRDAVDVGGGRWFLEAAACQRAARSSGAERLVFAPLC
jgi:hypothetical protein